MQIENEVIPLTEEQAVRRLASRDPAALSFLIQRYNRYVASIVCAVLGPGCSAQDAEELTADVFYSVFCRAGDIAPGKFRAYLGAAARNKAKDFLRSRKPPEADFDTITLPDEADAPETELLRQERCERVQKALSSLSPADREIFLRYYYYLQSTPEIAKAMCLSPGAVRTRLCRGRAALKDLLSKEDLP